MRSNLSYLWTTVAAGAVMLALATTGARGATVLTHEGLTFSVLNGGADLVSLSGTGTQADPIVLTETITGEDVTIEIQGLDQFPNETITGHDHGFWLRKVATNETGEPWTRFDLELQSELGEPSTGGDGLSFADGGGLTFSSDVFDELDQVTQERDFINFFDGTVANNETVTFNVAITDNQEHASIFLRQRPNVTPGGGGDPVIPTPAGFAAGALLLTMLGLRRHRR